MGKSSSNFQREDKGEYLKSKQVPLAFVPTKKLEVIINGCLMGIYGCDSQVLV